MLNTRRPVRADRRRKEECMSTIRRLMTSAHGIAVCVSILLLTASPTAAQETRATVFGSVLDASGGVLPGVPVRVPCVPRGQGQGRPASLRRQYLAPLYAARHSYPSEGVVGLRGGARNWGHA